MEQSLKPGVPKKVLVLLAAFAWSIAAALLFVWGFLLLKDSGLPWRFVLLIAGLTGLVFYWVLFARISFRYLLKLFRLRRDKPCVSAFFSIRSYLLMLLMTGSGLFLWFSGAVDASLLGLFYLIMGLPLLLSSTKFWYYGFRYRLLQQAYDPCGGIPQRPWRWQRRLWDLSSFALTFLVLLVIFTNWRISYTAAAFLYNDVNLIPENRVALVPGTSNKLANGSTNMYFKYRMEAVAKLYEAHKIRYVILSGDNGTTYYNEPREMKAELIRLGVPDSVIYADYAGFRTFDSVIRAWKVFGQKNFTFVSQRFQNERAIYIARAHGIEAIGFNAKDVSQYSGFKTKTRELLARVNVFVDLYLLNKQARFLGDPIQVGQEKTVTDTIK